MTVRLMLVKATIWSVSLGSGTSGGVLAPLLMMGSALGALEAHFLPAHGTGFWPIVSMAAILAGTMRAPLTAMIFAIELSGRFGLALPILTAGMVAHLFTVLVLRRSILTEKVARRGFHITREYATDPLELLVVREVMRTRLVALPAEATMDDIRNTLVREPAQRGQHLYPVVDQEKRIKGVITRKELRAITKSAGPEDSLGEVLRQPVVAHPGEPLRSVVFRMAETGLTRFPVVDDSGQLAGMISLHDLLMARVRNLNEERQRERVFRLRLPFGA
jgi:CBS domain-containing protein